VVAILSEVKQHLVFRIRKTYFDQIVSGKKTVEYRRDSPFWARTVIGPPDVQCLYPKILVLDDERRVAVFVCGKRVHRRLILRISRDFTPKDFSEQGKKDVDTEFCWEFELGKVVIE
jgi:hypothetical protein